jgi:very-short-patch-repair endonuclease
MPTSAVLREIRRASRPHGVAHGSAIRLTQHQLDRCCATGALERPHQFVFVDPAVPRTALQDLAIAVMAGGSLAAAWGRSAAALWDVIEHPPTPEIVVPHRRVAVVPGAIVHRSRDLEPSQIVHRKSIPCLDPLLATLSLGVVLSPIEVAEVIIAARQLNLFEPAAIGVTLSKVARPGRTGVRTTRAALDLVMIGDRPAESVLELRFAHGPARHGIPPFAYQHEVRIGGKRFYLDFAYPEVKLAIEVDGYDSRRSRARLDSDVIRQNLLVLNGWTVLRFTWTQVKNDPAGVAAAILQALGSLGYPFGR